MGIVWEAYHKGVPLLGVPGITLDMDSRGRNDRCQGSIGCDELQHGLHSGASNALALLAVPWGNRFLFQKKNGSSR